MKSSLTAAEVTDLRVRAEIVTAEASIRRGLISSREAAACMAGILSWIARRSGVAAMQAAATAIAQHEAAWTSQLARLPHEGGVVDEDVEMLAVVCRGVIDLAGPDNLRAALSFWATETDPAVWGRLFAA